MTSWVLFGMGWLSLGGVCGFFLVASIRRGMSGTDPTGMAGEAFSVSIGAASCLAAAFVFWDGAFRLGQW